MPKGDSKNPDDGFRLNEPAVKIPGGAKRKSTRVPRSDLKLVARREELDDSCSRTIRRTRRTRSSR